MGNKIITELRDFPSVEELLQNKILASSIAALPRAYASEIVKETVKACKKEFTATRNELTITSILDRIKSTLENVKRTEISKVINATGVVVHTNLGRAPLSDKLFDEVKQTVIGYGNIEYDTGGGTRGNRGEACENYLTLLSGAESATVVNNCAAALFLILNTLSNRKKVIISRSELVQIGGGFRIPDILKKSGAKLCEVGSTNITTIADYENEIDDKTGLILKVHQSNFVQKGFVDQPDIKDLVKLGKKYSIPVVNDLGSGVFIDTKEILGYKEPTVQQSVRQGADLTCFSGDKMLGGTQAGLIVGKKELVIKIKKNQLFRTMRVDKLVFSMLEKLLRIYLDGTYEKDIKLWKILSTTESELYKRGKKIHQELGSPTSLSVEASKGFVGGGALPESDIPSVALIFSADYKPNLLLKKFRALPTPIIGRIENDRFMLDLKAVDPEEISVITEAIKAILKSL